LKDRGLGFLLLRVGNPTRLGITVLGFFVGLLFMFELGTAGRPYPHVRQSCQTVTSQIDWCMAFQDEVDFYWELKQSRW
jgi:hypothetical protein